MWAYETTFYQIYPLGFCGAPRENAAPVAEEELVQAANAVPNPDAPIKLTLQHSGSTGSELISFSACTCGALRGRCPCGRRP